MATNIKEEFLIVTHYSTHGMGVNMHHRKVSVTNSEAQNTSHRFGVCCLEITKENARQKQISKKLASKLIKISLVILRYYNSCGGSQWLKLMIGL